MARHEFDDDGLATSKLYLDREAHLLMYMSWALSVGDRSVRWVIETMDNRIRTGRIKDEDAS